MTRVLDWDGCFNVRDLGGLPLEDGGETRYGVLVPLFGAYDPEFRDDIEDYMAADDPALAAVADADGPVCFHCAGGKDRTGIVAALVLRLAGVPLDEVGADYALSAVLLGKEPPRPNPSARWTFMQHTPPESMRRAIEHVERAHGSVAGYLRACGLDDARIERLRERLRP